MIRIMTVNIWLTNSNNIYLFDQTCYYVNQIFDMFFDKINYMLYFFTFDSISLHTTNQFVHIKHYSQDTI